MQIRTPWNFVLDDTDQEQPFGSSMTVPDMSYSVTDLLNRFANGNMPDVMHNPLYDDIQDDDFEAYDPTDAPDFDLADADALRADLAYSQNARKNVRDDIQILKDTPINAQDTKDNNNGTAVTE